MRLHIGIDCLYESYQINAHLSLGLLCLRRNLVRFFGISWRFFCFWNLCFYSLLSLFIGLDLFFLKMGCWLWLLLRYFNFTICFFLFGNIFFFGCLFLFWRSINIQLVHSFQDVFGIISIVFFLFLIWIIFLKVALLLTNNANKILEMLVQINAHRIVKSHSCFRLSVVVFRISPCPHVNWIIFDWFSELLSIHALKHVQ